MRLMSIQEVQGRQMELMKTLHTFLECGSIPYYLIAGSALGAVRHQGFIPWDDDIDIGMFREDYERFLEIAHKFDQRYDIANFSCATNCDYCLTRIYFPDTYIDNEYIKNTKLDQRLYMDVFPLDNVPEDPKKRDQFEKKIKKCKSLIALIDVHDYENSCLELILKKSVAMVLSPFRQSILAHCDKLMKTYRESQTDYVCSLSSQYSFRKQVMPKKYYGTPTLHCFEDSQFYLPEQIDSYLTTLYGPDYMDVPPEGKRRKGHDIYVIK